MFAVLRYLKRLDVINEHDSSLLTPLAKSYVSTPPTDDKRSGNVQGLVTPGQIMCDFKRHRLVSRTGKWKSTLAERRHRLWPPFCIGLAYILTGSLVPVLYRSSFHVPFLWLDDVYVTGFLPLHLGRGVVRHVALSQVYVFQSQLRKKMTENIAERGNQEFGVHWNSAEWKKLPAPAMFSHVHNLELYADVWNDLLTIERRKRRQRRHGVLINSSYVQRIALRRVNDSNKRQV